MDCAMTLFNLSLTARPYSLWVPRFEGLNRKPLKHKVNNVIMNKPNLAAIILMSAIFLPTLSLAKAVNESNQNNPAPDYIRSIVNNYAIPDVEVLRKDDKKLSFIKELDDGRPVMMNFIFASCSAICPMLSHVFMQVQNKLGKESKNIHLVSVSIDPENDTPAVLKEYAKKFRAGSEWDFYTGKLETSLAIQKAFNVYRGDKMNHSSVILIRTKPGEPWLRLEGFASPEAVIHEYRTILKN